MEDHTNFPNINSIIQIAIEPPGFNINAENKSSKEWYKILCSINPHLKEKILKRLNFSDKDIEQVK